MVITPIPHYHSDRMCGFRTVQASTDSEIIDMPSDEAQFVTMVNLFDGMDIIENGWGDEDDD